MIGFELRKLLRSQRPLHAALALLVFVILMLVGFYTYATVSYTHLTLPTIYSV